MNDQFWICVSEINDGGPFKCKFCGSVFELGTAISRIKSHLSGVKGCGVNICENVPADIQEAAYLDIHGTKKKLKTMPSSSNNEANNYTSSTSSAEAEQSNEIEMLEGDPEREARMEVEGIEEEEEVGDAEGTSSLEETGNEIENNMIGQMMQPNGKNISAERINVVDGHDTRGEAVLHEFYWLYNFSC